MLFFFTGSCVVVNATISGNLPPKQNSRSRRGFSDKRPLGSSVASCSGNEKSLDYTAGWVLIFQGSMLFIALIIFLLLQPLLTSTSFAISMRSDISNGDDLLIPFAALCSGSVARSKTHLLGRGRVLNN